MDDTELKNIVERFAPSVYRLAYARTGNRTDAEDVMQETFLRLVRAAPEFREVEHCRAWLLRVTVNCANSLFRSPWRRRTVPLDEALVQEETGTRGEVLDAVLALPKQYRMAVHLFYYEGLSCKEAAAVLGKSEQAVKNLLHRARNLLREELKGVELNA